MSRIQKRSCLFVAVAVFLAVGIAGFAFWYRVIRPIGRVEITEDLPFETSDFDSLPAANTPTGRPLTLASAAGNYSWVGLYGMIGGELEIRDDGTWVYEDRVVMGGVRRMSGSARIDHGRIELEVHTAKGAPTGKHCYCIPVQLWNRTYLLDRNRLIQFCDELNWDGNGSNANDRLLWFLHREMLSTPASAAPMLPTTYDKLILKHSLKGSITSVLPDGSAQVNIGSKQGVFEGMTLRGRTGESSENSVHSGARLGIVSLSSDTCVVKRATEGAPLKEGMEVWCPAEAASFK